MNIYVKSVWGTPHEKWAALSFGREGVANAFAAVVRSDDLIFLVGTGGEETSDPEERRAVLGVVSVVPGASYRTTDIVDADYYRAQVARTGHSWDNSIPASEMWSIPVRHDARDLIPSAYRRLGGGGIGKARLVEDPEERERLLALSRQPITFQHRKRVQEGRFDKESINGQLKNAVYLALERIRNSGKLSSRTNPVRITSDDLAEAARHALEAQSGLCYLCDQPFVIDPPKGYQISLDRPNSDIEDYAKSKPSHLRCNLAANKWGWQAAREYFNFIRTGEVPGRGDGGLPDG